MLRLMQFYLLMKYKMAVSADYRRLLKKEAKAYTICQKSFKKQEQFLLDHLEELYTKYPLQISLAYEHLNKAPNLYKKGRYEDYVEEPLGSFRAEMWVDDLIDKLMNPISKGVEKGYKRTRRKFKTILEENALIYNLDTMLNYVKDRGKLQLSNFRWAIAHTTKFEVIKVLKDWLNNQLTYNQVRDNIIKVNSSLFSKARARTIAVTEMAKAYEYGNVQPMRQLESVWVSVLKQWQTCEDWKVRPEHTECEQLGRVPLDFVYPSVWVQYPPGWPNCRCTMLHKIND